MTDWIRAALPYVQIGLAVLLVTFILVQSKGAGLSTVLGGEGNVYSTKRGAEKLVFIATIIVAVLFFATALLNAAI